MNSYFGQFSRLFSQRLVTSIKQVLVVFVIASQFLPTVAEVASAQEVGYAPKQNTVSQVDIQNPTTPAATTARLSGNTSVGLSTLAPTVNQTANSSQSAKQNALQTVNLGSKVDVDQSSGAFLYTFPLKIPAGRRGQTPPVSLNYDSRRMNLTSYIGLGWELDIPRIERMNKNGLDVMFDETNFTSSMSGELKKSATSTSKFGEYFVKYDYGTYIFKDDNTWEFTDKDGTKYIFGATTRDRIDNGNPDRIQSWYLSSMTDTLGNTITFLYVKGDGKLYPQSVIWADGVYRIDFTYENYTFKVAGPTQYDDTGKAMPLDLANVVDYGAGVRATSDRRLTGISISALGDRRANYTLDSGDYLKSIIGPQGTTRFEYKDKLPAPTSVSTGAAYNEIDPALSLWPQARAEFLTAAPTYRTNISNTYWASFDNNRTQEYLITYDNTKTTPWSKVLEAYAFQADGAKYYAFKLVATSTLDGTDKLDAGIFSKNKINASDYYIAGLVPTNNVYKDNRDGIALTLNRLPTAGAGTSTVSLYVTYDSTKKKYVELTGNMGVQTKISKPLTIPLDIQKEISLIPNSTTTIMDVNFDNLDDVIVTSDQGMRVYINKGDSFQYDPKYTLVGKNFTDSNAVQFFRDINGDGKPDYYRAGRWFLNRGDFFQYSEEYSLAGVNQLYYLKSANDLYDINGDGLLDIPSAQRINTGTGFAVVLQKQLTSMAVKTNYFQDLFNYNAATAALPTVNGTGVLNRAGESLTVLGDLNGDGLPDVYSSYTGAYRVYYTTTLSSVPKFDSAYVGKLIHITTTMSADANYIQNVSLTYEQQDMQNEYLDDEPTKVWAVKTIDYGQTAPQLSFGNTSTTTTTFKYENGVVYRDQTELTKRDAGFFKVTATDPLGFSTLTYFHQGNGDDATSSEKGDHPSKIGKAYRVEQYNPSGTLLSTSRINWNAQPLGNDRYFLFKESEENYNHIKQLATAKGYTYDTLIGEPIRTNDYGFIQPSSWSNINGSWNDTGDDTLITEQSYVTNGVIVRPTKTQVLDKNGVVLKESTQIWDNNSLSKGLLTESDVRMSATKIIPTKYSYSAKGTANKITDALGRNTTLTLDNYELFPTAVTNALGQTTSFTYDYWAGKPSKITSPTGVVEDYTYEPNYGFETSYKLNGRPVRAASIIAGNAIGQTEYLGDTNTATPARSVPSNTNVTQNFYFDQQGRLVLTISSMAGNTQTAYDAAGRKTIETPSVWDSTLAGTTRYAYDNNGNLAQITTPFGITSYQYGGSKVTETGANGATKTTDFDARGNILSVAYNSDPATRYTYDPVGNLTKITDADGNIREFTYDLMGNRRTLTDVHNPSDPTVGAYAFTYDDLGRVISTLRPDGTTMDTIYDALGRVTTTNYASSSISYNFDTCGAGYLCSSTRGSVRTDYVYNADGRVATTTTTVGTVNKKVQYYYTDNGNIAQVVYPKMTLTYRYQAGRNTPTDVYLNTSNTPLYSATFLDAAHPQTITKNYASATGKTFSPLQTTFVYDYTHLGALTSKKTSIAGSNAQDLTYTRNNVNEISQIADNGTAGTKKTTTLSYDLIDRLTGYSITAPAKGSPVSISYTYSPAGNMLSSSVAGTFGYNATGTGDLVAGSLMAIQAPPAKMSQTPAAPSTSSSTNTVTSTATSSSVATTTVVSTTATTSKATTTTATAAVMGTVTPITSTTTTTASTTKAATTTAKTSYVPSLMSRAIASLGALFTPTTAYADTATDTPPTTVNDDPAGHIIPPAPTQASSTTISTSTSSSTPGIATKSGSLVLGTTTEALTQTVTPNDLLLALLYKLNNGAFNITQQGNVFLITDLTATSTNAAYASSTATTTVDQRSGSIVINRGRNWATVSFKKEMPKMPKVLITPAALYQTNYAVNSVSTKGFSLNLADVAPARQSYSYLAIAGDEDNAESDPDVIQPDLPDIYKFDEASTTASTTIDIPGTYLNQYTNPQAIVKMGDTVYLYNRFGNLIEVRKSSGTEYRSYTEDNRMKTLENAQILAAYLYDASGNKVQETVLNKTTWVASTTTYINDDYTVNADGSETYKIRIAGNHVASWTVKADGSTYLDQYLTDPVGTSNAVVDEMGVVKELTDTNPYGDVRVNQNNTSVASFYALHERNDATNLIDMEARYYDPFTMQFTGEDPAAMFAPEKFLSDPQQLNTYAYARNNPVRYNDPSGNDATMVIGFGSAASTGLITTAELAAIGTAAVYVSAGAAVVAVGSVGLYWSAGDQMIQSTPMYPQGISVRSLDDRYGSRYVGTVQTTKSEDLGVPEPPSGPEDMFKNLKPKNLKGIIKYVAIGLGLIAADQYETFKKQNNSLKDYNSASGENKMCPSNLNNSNKVNSSTSRPQKETLINKAISLAKEILSKTSKR